MVNAEEINDTTDKNIISKNNHISNDVNEVEKVVDSSRKVNNSVLGASSTKSNSSTPTVYYVDINKGSDSNSGTKNKPFKTFEYSITKTHNGDTILLANGNYRLTRTMKINYTLTINGTSKTNTIVNCPTNSNFIIGLNSYFENTTVKLNHLTFRNGRSPNSYTGVFKIVGYNTGFYANDTLFMNNGGKYGGVIYNEAEEGLLNFTNCEFKNNNASVLGGAICTAGSYNNVYLTGCVFANNHVNYTPASSSSNGSGGAIYHGGSSTNSVYIKNCSFNSNIAKMYGGAIYMTHTVKLNVTSSNFTNNQANIGGAMSVRGQNNLNLSSSRFNNNKASGFGGAMYVRGSENILNCNFTSNSAQKRGGALYTDGNTAKININNSIFDKNFINATGERFGGAWAGTSRNGMYELYNDTFSSNRAPSGGAIYLTGYRPDLDILDCKFLGNNATSTGGVLYSVSDYARIDIDNSIINNSYSNKYGAVFGLRGVNSYCDINGVNITNNKVNGYGGVVFMDKAGFGVYRSIIANNTALGSGSGVKPGWGGVVYANNSYGIDMSQSIVQNNTAKTGGIIYIKNGSSTSAHFIDNSDLYNNTNQSIYSPKVFFNATHNWWGRNDANNTVNKAITGKNNVSIEEPIVCVTTLTPSYDSTTNRTRFTTMLRTKIYNATGDLKLYRTNIDFNISYKMINKTNNKVIEQGTKILDRELSIISGFYKGNLTNKIYYQATLENQTFNIYNNNGIYVKINELKINKTGKYLDIDATTNEFHDYAKKGYMQVTFKLDGKTIAVHNPITNKTATNNITIQNASIKVRHNLTTTTGTHTLQIRCVYYPNYPNSGTVVAETTKKIVMS